MDQKQTCREMIELNKAAFDNIFNAMSMFQDQILTMTAAVLQQNDWLPEEGKKAGDELVSNYQRGREDFRKIVEDGFKRVEAFFID